MFVPSREERDEGFYFGYVKFKMFLNCPHGRGEPAVIYSGLKSPERSDQFKRYKFEVTAQGTRETV